MARVGLLGGTFDPIHHGHLEAAEAARDCARLDEVLLIPAGRPPHKRATRASAADRLEMTRLAAAGRAWLGVWDWEAGRPGRSYTVDTLRAFRKLRPADDPFLILGWDAARDLRTWRKPEEVLRLARLVVVGRPGLDSPTPEGLRLAGIDPQQAILCMQPTPDVAATTVRRRAATGEPLEDLVPGAVEDYIRERGLYPEPKGIIEQLSQPELSPLELAKLIQAAAEDKLAQKPVRIPLKGKTTVADYFVIVEGETDRQVKAIADGILERAREHRVRPLAVDGYEDGSWVLIDFDSVLVHIFLPGERSFYDLESLWSTAARRRANS